jgi:enoyl-CoA hydratase
MSYSTIQLERDGPVAIIRLHRPERMNAVIEEMYEEILEVLRSLADDRGVRCLILTGSVLLREGVRKQAFCAGADLVKHAAGERTAGQRRAYIELAHRTALELFRFPRPILAAVNGPARGAGTEMALACDLMFMAEKATLAFPETGVGSFVGGGVTALLPRLVGLATAKDLVYSGRVIDGGEAVRLGLALRAVPVERLESVTLEYARELAARAPLSVALVKRFLQRPPVEDLDTVLRLEANAILDCMETEDWAEGARAFTERRKPHFEGK